MRGEIMVIGCVKEIKKYGLRNIHTQSVDKKELS